MAIIKIPDGDFAYVEATIEFEGTSSTEQVIAVSDKTYDDTISLKTLITTETDLLNLDPEEYGENFKNVDIELGSNFGGWTFGEDTLGNKQTMVKTVKLSGKGYNIKTVLVDFTKSKWTLETMGITYKMRKARSR